MRRALFVVYGIVGLVATGLLLTLWAQERGGPPHRDVTVAGDIPATFYLPEGAGKPVPAVIVGHGLSGDRATMSSLSRKIADAGYAVLAIDFHGHGANENLSLSGDLDLTRDLAAAVAWLEDSSDVDPERIAVLGHSMGAYAALDFAVFDRATPVAALSGGHYGAADGHIPPRVLFVIAEHDPPGVRTETRASARRLERTGVDVDYAEIPDADHITILWSDDTAARVVSWLDETSGMDRADPIRPTDPRLAIAFLYGICVLVLLTGIGLGAGALAAAPPGRLAQLRAVVLPSCLAAAGGAALFLPLGSLVHRLVPVPGRAILAIVVAFLAVPFFGAFQLLLRRRGFAVATAASVAGHGLLVGVLSVGVRLGVLPSYIALVLPLLLVLFLIVEVFAAAAYARSRNALLIGVVEGAWISGLIGVAFPISFIA